MAYLRHHVPIVVNYPPSYPILCHRRMGIAVPTTWQVVNDQHRILEVGISLGNAAALSCRDLPARAHSDARAAAALPSGGLPSVTRTPIDPDLLRRALFLNVERLIDGSWLVSGCDREHHVARDDGGLACDCMAHRADFCEHILAIVLRTKLSREVRAGLRTIANQPARIGVPA